MSEVAVLDRLVEDFYQVWLRYHPVAALQAGVPGFGGRLAADGDDDMGALATLLRDLLVSLEELDYWALDADQQLDMDLLFGEAMIEYRSLMQSDWRRQDPARYLPLKELQTLVIRQPEGYCAALEGLLAGTPDYLRDARGKLSEVPELVSPLCLAEAIETAEAGLPWLKRLARELPQEHECCPDQGLLQTLASQTAEAVSSFRDFLVNDLAPVAQGDAACGTDRLGHLLKYRHQLAWSGEEALEVAQSIREGVRHKLRERGQDEATLSTSLSSAERLTGEERRRAYKQELDRLSAFNQRQEILPVIARSLELRVTENCFTFCDCGSYLRDAQGGALLIPSDAQRHEGETLDAIRQRVIYAGWLGRHFLSWAQGDGQASLVRRLNPSTILKQGWAHYIGHLLEEQGYFAPMDLPALWYSRLMLAEQAVLDIEFHLGRISGIELLERLKRLAPQRGLAESRLTTLSHRPGDAFMALLSERMLDATRRTVLQAEPRLGLSDYHARLLAHGPLSLPLIVKRIFGAKIWESVLSEVGP